MYKIQKAEKLADKIFLMDVEAKRVAKHCEPGQFVIVKMDEKGERIPLRFVIIIEKQERLPLYSKQLVHLQKRWQN